VLVVLVLVVVLVVRVFFAFGRKYIYIMNTMTTMMILCAGVLSRLFSFFFLGYVFFASSHKHDKNTFAPVRKTL